MHSKISGKQCLQSISCLRFRKRCSGAPLPNLAVVTRMQLVSLVVGHHSVALIQMDRESFSWLLTIAYSYWCAFAFAVAARNFLCIEPNLASLMMLHPCWCEQRACFTVQRGNVSFMKRSVLPKEDEESTALPVVCLDDIKGVWAIICNLRNFAK